jgi:Fe2+ transport system protein FeoA
MRAENNSTEPRALIIEDEILIAEELRERLSRLGFLRHRHCRLCR